MHVIQSILRSIYGVCEHLEQFVSSFIRQGSAELRQKHEVNFSNVQLLDSLLYHLDIFAQGFYVRFTRLPAIIDIKKEIVKTWKQIQVVRVNVSVSSFDKYFYK